MRPTIDWRTAIYAGVAAGIISTVAQIMLWWIFWDALPEILYRDARLTAAIALGRGILPLPPTFDWQAMSVATLIHFALSIVYGLIIAWFIAGRGMLFAILAGALFGVVLFAINMYGFTIIFPWFTETRDWITLIAHAVFGASCATAYKTLIASPSRK